VRRRRCHQASLVRFASPRRLGNLVAGGRGVPAEVGQRFPKRAVGYILPLRHEQSQQEHSKHRRANSWITDHENAFETLIRGQLLLDDPVEVPILLSDEQPVVE
jgi:hypothetical protein